MRDFKKVGGGIYSTTDRIGNPIMALVKLEGQGNQENAVVIYQEQNKSRCVELVQFLTSK